MFSQNDYQMLLVGQDVAKGATAATHRATNMNAGEIGVFTPGGFLYTEATADPGEEFIVVLKQSDGNFLTSETISKSKVVSVTRKVAVADAEQLSYVGYNGTSGSIEAINNNFYRIRVNLREFYDSNSHGTSYLKHAIYESDDAATQAEIAIGLAGNGVANMSREPKNSSGDPFVKFKAIVDTAASATNDFDNDASIVKGSKTFVVATNLQYNSGGGTLAVGDFIRFADALNGTLALTDDVYKVTAIDTLTVTVDRPIGVPSGTWTDAGDGIQIIPAATGVAANWGILIQGQAQDFSANSIQGSLKKYKKIVFDLSIEDFGTTAYGTTTKASLGTGQPEQIMELEIFCRGNNGEFYRTGVNTQFPWTLQTLTTEATYDIIEIVYEGKQTGLTSVTKRKVLTLAIPGTATPAWADTGTADDITDVLEDLLDGAVIYGGAVTANGGALADGDLAI